MLQAHRMSERMLGRVWMELCLFLLPVRCQQVNFSCLGGFGASVPNGLFPEAKSATPPPPPLLALMPSGTPTRKSRTPCNLADMSKGRGDSMSKIYPFLMTEDQYFSSVRYRGLHSQLALTWWCIQACMHFAMCTGKDAQLFLAFLVV